MKHQEPVEEYNYNIAGKKPEFLPGDKFIFNYTEWQVLDVLVDTFKKCIVYYAFSRYEGSRGYSLNYSPNPSYFEEGTILDHKNMINKTIKENRQKILMKIPLGCE